MKYKILLVGCSVRSTGILENGCNTEIALGAVKEGIGKFSEVEYINLNKWFLPNGSVKNVNIPINKIKKADGVVFATPVYFGQASSLFQDLVSEMGKRDVDLYPKAVGFVSVGAKRNGGEETTITWMAWDIMNLGACIVNDGHPISQFGGVVVAGTRGNAKYDMEGLETCRHLGRRIFETVKILKAGNLNSRPKTNIWLMDFNCPPHEGVSAQYGLVEIYKHNFHRCLGHDPCPNPKCKEDYKCYNQCDGMKEIHGQLIESEGIVPVGWNARFMERTRYLRRDNYRLTYSVAHIPNPRYIPFFIKENSILARQHFPEYVNLISSGKNKLIIKKAIYDPQGYEK